MIAAALLIVGLLPGSDAGQTTVEGVWKARYTNTEGRAHEFTLTIKTSDGAISGTVSSPRGSVPITRGTVTGRDIEFTVTRRANYDQIDVTFTGTIDGDAMRLTLRVGAREAVTVTARREAGQQLPTPNR
jgi:hypothetical protein